MTYGPQPHRGPFRPPRSGWVFCCSVVFSSVTFVKGQSGNPKGRPNRKDAHARPIARAEKRIADRLPLLIDKMFELAEGVLVEETTITKDGFDRQVYQRPPDRSAIQYLADRIMGKPTEKIDAEVHGAFEVVKSLDDKAWESV